MRIRIKSTPPATNTPDWVREAWVGLEMESLGKENLSDRDLLVEGRGGRKNIGGYKVVWDEASRVLRKHNEEAYLWWLNSHPDATMFVFHIDVCEEIPNE